MLARGWLAYPVTPAAHATTAEERLQKYHRHIHRRGATELFRNPVRGAKRMRAGGSPLLVAGRLPTDGYDAADSTFLAKIFSVIYTTALRR